MGLIFKARGGANLGLFILRLAVGFLFLFAGAEKLMDIEGFINSVKAMDVLPDNLAFIFGFILPFAQVFLGGLFIIGLFTPIVSFFLSALTLSILMMTGLGDPVHAFSLNWIVLACTLCVMFSGAGVISFDSFFDKKKHREVNYAPSYETTGAVQKTVIIKEEKPEVKTVVKEEVKEKEDDVEINVHVKSDDPAENSSNEEKKD